MRASLRTLRRPLPRVRRHRRYVPSYAGPPPLAPPTTSPGKTPMRVDIALDLDPFTRPGDSDWTRVDATSPARALFTKRGTRVKTSELEPSEQWIELDDAEGHMNPENTGSTWYPDLGLRRRVRAVLEPEGDTDRTMMTGFISAFDKKWRAQTATMTLDLDDLLTIAGGKKLPGSVLEHTIKGLAPDNYWPLGDPSGTVCEDVVGNLDGTYLQAVAPADALLPYDGRPSQLLGYDAAADYRQNVSIPGFPALPDEFTWVMVVQFPDDPLTDDTYFDLIHGENPTSGSKFRFRFSAFPESPSKMVLVGQMDRNETTALDRTVETIQNATDYYGPGRVYDGATHVVAWTFKASTDAGNAFYIDAVKIADGQVTHTVSGAGTAAGIATDLVFGRPSGLFDVRCIASHIAFFPRILTQAELTSIQEAAFTAWDGDTVDERCERLFDAVGVDPDDLDLAVCSARCGPAVLGRTLREELAPTVATEPGALMWCAADGKITLELPAVSGATSEETYSDVGTDDPLWETLTREPLSVARAINVATVSWVAGEQTIEDTDQTDVNGPLPVSISTLARTADGARDVAARTVYRYGTPRSVVSSVRVMGNLPLTTLEATVDRDVNDVVTIGASPPNDITIAQKSVIETVTHEWGNGVEWWTEFGLVELVTLPGLKFDTAGRGWDRTSWPA